MEIAIFKKAWGQKEKRRRVKGYNHSSPQNMFKEILTAIATLQDTADPREARKMLRKVWGLSYETSLLRFNQALEVQKWLNEQNLIFRYHNES